MEKRRNNTIPAVALFVLLLGLWLLMSGHYTPLMIGFGVASCASVVALAWRLKVVDWEGVPVHLLGRSILYVPWIAWEVIKANLDVARRILSPSLNISPKVFETKASQKTDLGKVLYANSITLTPGTVSIWVNDDTITVHAIAEEVADSLDEGAMDRMVAWLEGLQ